MRCFKKKKRHWKIKIKCRSSANKIRPYHNRQTIKCDKQWLQKPIPPSLSIFLSITHTSTHRHTQIDTALIFNPICRLQTARRKQQRGGGDRDIWGERGEMMRQAMLGQTHAHTDTHTELRWEDGWEVKETMRQAEEVKVGRRSRTKNLSMKGGCCCCCCCCSTTPPPVSEHSWHICVCFGSNLCVWLEIYIASGI